MTKLSEDDIEQLSIELLENQGYNYIYDSNTASEGKRPIRELLKITII